MTIGDLRDCIEGLSDSMEIVVGYGDKALWVGGLGIASMGQPAKFEDNPMTLVRGVSVFEITARDHA